MNLITRCFLIVAVSVTAFPMRAQTAPLSVDEIMAGPNYYGFEPMGLRWSGDGKQLFFQWKQANETREKETDTYVVNRDGAGLRKLSEAEAKLAPPINGVRSRDKHWIAFTENGDVFLHDWQKGARRRLTETVEVESSPSFTPDGKGVLFLRGGNLFVLNLDDASLKQLTDIRQPGATTSGASRSNTENEKGTESQEWLKKEERSLLDVIARRAEQREKQETKRNAETPRKPYALPLNTTVISIGLSSDERFALALLRSTNPKAIMANVPAFVNEKAYTESIPSRSKVGDLQPNTKLLRLEVKRGEAKEFEHDLKDANGKALVLRLQPVMWSEDATKAALLAFSEDNKDRWVFAVDLENAKLRVLAHQRDEAWIGGPGVFTLGFVEEDVYYLSEETGFSHLCRVPFAGGASKALTSGAWEIRSVRLSEDKKAFWITSGEASAFEEQLYKMSIHGGPRTRVTRSVGLHEATPSPDEKLIADLHSTANHPPELFLQSVGQDKVLPITRSPSAAFQARKWIQPPIVQIPASDGARVPARLYKNENWKPGGPAVIFVHGAGYLQNVHQGWSRYAREYAFHHLLMERGYLVLDLDYRASAGYGRDWRTAVHRHMGGRDLDDHVDAAAWLIKEHGVDAQRIGIYGGSYGGFITLMAMFTKPDVFKAGAALRPVTDWAHYNHGYTSNILNEPQKDAEAYRQSSPIYHAAGLKGALLICHGMIDTNVHFQDSVRLAQKLQELKKENWELAVYPIEDHSFVETSSWIDEYKRILKLFETHLKK
jgi:dipeptidyl aminopeptidase/acylaminoacyl peptidase